VTIFSKKSSLHTQYSFLMSYDKNKFTFICLIPRKRKSNNKILRHSCRLFLVNLLFLIHAFDI
jgi:hypothetical protein